MFKILWLQRDKGVDVAENRNVPFLRQTPAAENDDFWRYYNDITANFHKNICRTTAEPSNNFDRFLVEQYLLTHIL